MPDLSIAQYDIVYNLFSFTFATMFASFIFYVLVRSQLAPQYRMAMIMSATPSLMLQPKRAMGL